MTDARLPEKWLADKRVLMLTDAGYRLFVTGLLWAVSNRSDGLLLGDDLALMPRVDASRAEELVEAGLWAYDGTRWYVIDFSDTQTSKEQLEGLEKRRRQDRERQQRLRDKQKESRDSSRDDIGQDRQGQARTGTEGRGYKTSSSTTELTGAHQTTPEVRGGSDVDWPTPAVPGAAEFARVGAENTHA